MDNLTHTNVASPGLHEGSIMDMMRTVSKRLGERREHSIQHFLFFRDDWRTIKSLCGSSRKLYPDTHDGLKGFPLLSMAGIAATVVDTVGEFEQELHRLRVAELRVGTIRRPDIDHICNDYIRKLMRKAIEKACEATGTTVLESVLPWNVEQK